MFKNSYVNKYDLPILFSLFILNIITILCFPLYIYYNGIVWQEPVLFFVGWIIAGLGITIGYHRYFSHKAFKTYSFIEWILMLFGTMGLQNRIINWCSDHRRHHRKLDTDQDPYSIKEGFFHAHIGWIIKKDDRPISGISDLTNKSCVKFQNTFYWSMVGLFCFIIPLILGFFFNRPIGGLLWGGIVRIVLVHHFTFFINSLCHFKGKKSYDLYTTARDSWLTAFLTFGEGYHNYHHKFQFDYRNGIKWYSFDPSKWVIKVLSLLKLAYKLRKAPVQSILYAQIETINNKISNLSKKINISKSHQKAIVKITKNAYKNIDAWKVIEKKYNSIKNSRLTKRKTLLYNKKKKIFEIEIKNALSSLMLIFLNLRKTL